MTNFDPTKNRIPLGLLSEAERAALKDWPHGWEFYSNQKRSWHQMVGPSWWDGHIYRGKPAPVVTSIWLNAYPWGVINFTHTTREKADKVVTDIARIAVLRIDTCNGVSTAHLEDI